MRYLAVAVLLLTCGVAWAGNTVVVTTASDGTPANADIDRVWISGDGTVAAFITAADNLVVGDTNGTRDLFTKRLATGETRRVSLRSDGGQLDQDVRDAAISQDGTFVAFTSYADAFTPSGPLGAPALYFQELPSGPVEAILYDPSHAWGSWIADATVSADGRYIAFAAIWENLIPGVTVGPHVYLYDRQTSAFSLVSQGTNGEFDPEWPSSQPQMTPDGRYVVFQSRSPILVSGDTNGLDDIFLRDLQEGTTVRVSLLPDNQEIPVGEGNGQYPSISADGRYVAFMSPSLSFLGDTGMGLAQVYVRDLETGEVTLVSSPDGLTPSDRSCWWSHVTGGDVPLATFTSEATNLISDLTEGLIPYVYQRDLAHDTLDLVTCEVDGEPMEPTSRFVASDDASVVAFVAERTPGLGKLGLAPKQGYKRTRGPFWDVGSRHWAVTQIEDCYAAAIVGGYSDHSYRPAATVTRDQMAVFIARALAGGDAAIPTGPPVATFPDVDTAHWAYRYVEYAAANGVVGGYEDGSYQPGLVVTRDAMAVFVARGMAGGEEAVPTGPPTATFSDVATNHWAYRHVEYCVGAGVVAGYPDGTYRPDDAVDRAQMAVYVERGFLGG